MRGGGCRQCFRCGEQGLIRRWCTWENSEVDSRSGSVEWVMVGIPESWREWRFDSIAGRWGDQNPGDVDVHPSINMTREVLARESVGTAGTKGTTPSEMASQEQERADETAAWRDLTGLDWNMEERTEVQTVGPEEENEQQSR
ncbi:unnamed protein product [Gordionus sp. m RMFG-2023]